MDSDIGKSRDRISKLEDSILCQILSFLPTKYAVGTSILSRRWRYLWTSVPNPSFDFDESLLFQTYSELSQDRQIEVDFTFKDVVSRVLLLSDATCFKKFQLNIKSACNLVYADTWICAAIKRKVKEIELSICLEDKYMLPAMLFSSQTLVILKLIEGIVLEVPDSVWLPSLKILDLDFVECEEEDSFHSLFLGCPVLEELYIQTWNLDAHHQVLNISVPTLKILRLSCPPDYHNIGESGNRGSRVVVNTPKLEKLDLVDFVSEEFVVENLPSLLTAHVFVGPSHSRTRLKNYCTYKLLSGINNVKFLDATLPFPTHGNTPVLPTLHNLTHLTLGADDAIDLNLLTDFLECSPNLEVLILKQFRLHSSSKCWSPPRRVPNCMLLHLKEVEIKEFNGEGYELEAIGYLLKNAKVLKKMTIDCQCSYNKDGNCRCSNSKDGICIWQKLLGIPRGSTTCLLNLIF